MKRILVVSFAILAGYSSFSFAVEYSDFSSSETAKELLVFSYYDWEELLVEAPTRRPVPLKHVAENMTIITAEEIKAMNAHSLGGVLENYSGLLFGHYGHEFAGAGGIQVHAAEYRHQILLLDGVRMTDDTKWPNAEGLPVQIIERIEIIKGPASSVWGSALGGVINIVTKDGGSDTRPSGTLYGSVGEGPSQDYRAEAAGRGGKVKYYVYGGYQDTDGIQYNEYYTNKNFYSKFTAELTEDVSLQFTGGYLNPKGMFLKSPVQNWGFDINKKHSFITGRLTAVISQSLSLDADLNHRKFESDGDLYFLSTGGFGNGEYYEQDDTNGSVRLSWTSGNHTVLFGTEYTDSNFDRTMRYGPVYQRYYPPVVEYEDAYIEEWGVFLNDTIQWGKLTVTPGIRYDYYSIADVTTDGEVNPSLGVVYQLTDETLARATLARGFVRPDIMGVKGFDIVGNPDLKPEVNLSFQAGIESTEINKLHLKADVFYHEQDDVWAVKLIDAGRWYVNSGRAYDKGVELSAAASLLPDLTASLGYMYVHNDRGTGKAIKYHNQLVAKLDYRGERFGNLLLIGRYNDWGDPTSGGSPLSNADDLIVDAHYNKDVYTSNSGITLNVFFSARNIFNGTSHWQSPARLPDRWVEAGVRINF